MSKIVFLRLNKISIILFIQKSDCVSEFISYFPMLQFFHERKDSLTIDSIISQHTLFPSTWEMATSNTVKERYYQLWSNTAKKKSRLFLP